MSLTEYVNKLPIRNWSLGTSPPNADEVVLGDHPTSAIAAVLR